MYGRNTGNLATIRIRQEFVLIEFELSGMHCIYLCVCVFYGSFFALFRCFFCLSFFLISNIVFYKCDCSCVHSRKMLMCVRNRKGLL